jgi:peptidoglycan hydrolase-like protein with peptidoglycan-binding domain
MPTPKLFYKLQDLNCDPKSATLQVGSKGNKVIELQTYLTDLGYGDLLDPEKIDGKFGAHTKNSVMAYQKDFGLSVDGIIGPQSWKSLCEQVSLLLTTFPTNNISN